MADLVLLGAGGHAKVVLENLQAQGEHRIVGALDPSPSVEELLGIPVLGGDEQLGPLRRAGVEYVFVAVGDNRLRRRIGSQAVELGFRLANAIHPAATISPSARLGVGVAIMAGAVINAAAEVADLVVLNTGALIEHDCTVGPAAHLAPGAAIAGGVRIGEEAFLGTGARVIPGVQIGARATVGAGAVVIRDVPHDAVAYGVPAQTRDRTTPTGA